MKIENPFKDAEDKLLFAKALDKYTAAEKKRQQTHTDFLDPVRCAAFVQTLSRGNNGVYVEAYGGYDGAERKMIAFDTADIDMENFPIIPVAATYNERFAKAPTHRDYLGAVLGLGLDRGKVGDIRLGETGAVLYLSADMAYYVAENLDQVGRVSVKCAVHQTLAGLEATGAERRVTVPSMRLDAVLGSAFNLSRGKAAALIESDKVFVNWKPAKKTQPVAVGDAITVRGVGRVKVESVEGSTKKDRIVLRMTVNK